jgi:hypothetical protein
MEVTSWNGSLCHIAVCEVESCISVEWILSSIQNPSINHAHPQILDYIMSVTDSVLKQLHALILNILLTQSLNKLRSVVPSYCPSFQYCGMCFTCCLSISIYSTKSAGHFSTRSQYGRSATFIVSTAKIHCVQCGLVYHMSLVYYCFSCLPNSCRKNKNKSDSKKESSW